MAKHDTYNVTRTNEAGKAVIVSGFPSESMAESYITGLPESEKASGIWKVEADSSFNGWKNWDTWNTALWILNNSEADYKEARRIASYSNASVAKSGLRKLAKSMQIPDKPKLANVDWQEILDALRE